MTKKIKSIDDMPVDIVEATKRGFLYRGFIPRKYHRNSQLNNEDAKKGHSSKEKELDEDRAKSDESYPERVSEGESDKKIEEEEEKNKDKLKTEVPGSKTATGPEDLQELAEKSSDVLYEAETVWPFTLFPDTIKLDREKLTIANRQFWRVANITSVPVGEIMSAEAGVGPFFGNLDLTFRFFTNNEQKINFLKRKDAIELQRLIHGYIIAHRREIDVSSVSKDELIKLLTNLGQGVSD